MAKKKLIITLLQSRDEEDTISTIYELIIGKSDHNNNNNQNNSNDPTSEEMIRKKQAEYIPQATGGGVDIIDSMPAIKEYLETGKQEEAEKKMQNELEVTAARNKSILEAAVDAIIVTNTKGVIQVFNSSAEKLFGYTSEEILGKNVKLLMTEAVAMNHDYYMARYLDPQSERKLGTIREQQGMYISIYQ